MSPDCRLVVIASKIIKDGCRYLWSVIGIWGHNNQFGAVPRSIEPHSFKGRKSSSIHLVTTVSQWIRCDSWLMFVLSNLLKAMQLSYNYKVRNKGGKRRTTLKSSVIQTIQGVSTNLKLIYFYTSLLQLLFLVNKTIPAKIAILSCVKILKII